MKYSLFTIIILLSVYTTSFSQCDRTADSLELVKFYNAMDGPNWTIKWDLSEEFFKWHGVKRKYYSPQEVCVTEISLSDNNLTGELYAPALDSLKEFALRKGDITGIIPEDFPTSIELLSLEDLNISGTIPSFNDQINLEALVIKDCDGIIGNIPNFSNSSIKFLNLKGLSIEGELPDFDQLDSLEWLDITYNSNLSGNVPNYSFKNLRTLWLHNNNLTGELPSLDSLPNLEVFIVASNSLSGELPPLSGSEKLFQYFAQDNKFTGDIPLFENKTKLEYIHVDENELDGTLPPFEDLSSLGVFTCSENKLTGEVPSSYSGIWKFEAKNNKLDSIIQLDSLYWLRVNGNLFTFDDLFNTSAIKNGFDYWPMDSIPVEPKIYVSNDGINVIDIMKDDGVLNNTYNWFINDMYVATTEKNELRLESLTFTDESDWRVEWTNPDFPELTLISTEFNVDSDLVSSSDFTNSQIDVNPTIFDSFITITNIEDKDWNFTLYNKGGQIVEAGKVTPQLNLEYVPIGVYILLLQDGKGYTVFRKQLLKR